MELRKAEFSDLSAITAIYKDAKEALKAQGIDQWQDGYPNEESARADIENGTSYVLADESGVFATACLTFGHEPTYDAVYGGAWQAEGEYGFLHRVAVSGTRKRSGAASRFFEELKRQAEERDVKILWRTEANGSPMNVCWKRRKRNGRNLSRRFCPLSVFSIVYFRRM